MAHRNLLYLLSLKELRTRYKKSILGWAWSLLNPLSQMLIFTIIFKYVFRQNAIPGDPSGLRNFPLYFLAGLLPFNFFARQQMQSCRQDRGFKDRVFRAVEAEDIT